MAEEDEHVIAADEGEEGETPCDVTPPLPTPSGRKRKSPDTQVQEKEMEMLETVNATLRSLTQNVATKHNSITSYCQYLEHEFRAMEASDPRYFRYVQGQIAQLI